MTVLEFASMFKMTVQEMCEFTGYERQALSELVLENKNMEDVQKFDVYHDLVGIALEIRAEEMQVVDTDYKERRAVIKQDIWRNVKTLKSEDCRREKKEE